MLLERYFSSFDNTRLYAASRGEGPAIVLCDGLGCDGFIWRRLSENLAKHHQVITWNYRGHGLSQAPRHSAALGIEALAGDLRAVMDAFGLTRTILMGHSMGAQVIFEFALRHPDRVRALITVCGSFGRPLDSLHDSDRLGRLFPFFKASVEKFPIVSQRLWRAAIRSRLAYAVASRFEVNGKIVQTSDFAPYFDHLGVMNLGVFVALVAEAQAHTTRGRLHQILTPTLIIAGDQDTFTPARISERIAKEVARAELMIVPGGSHITPIEMPELVSLRVEKFLKNLAPLSTERADA